MKNRFQFVTFLALIIKISAIAQEETHSINDLLNQKVPGFKGLLISGDSISTSDLIGKVTLIQFLYLGCPPCMHEVPFYNNLYNELDKSKFDLIAICPETFNTLKSFNENDSTSPAHWVHDFSKVKRIDYKVLAECKEMVYPFGRPQCSTITDKFYIRGYPYSVLLDKSGVIREIYEGFSTDYEKGKKEIDNQRADIEKLMNE